MSVLRLSSIYLDSKKAELDREEEIQPPVKALKRAGAMVKQVALWMAESETCFPPWRSRFTPLTSPMGANMLDLLIMPNSDLKQEEKHV